MAHRSKAARVLRYLILQPDDPGGRAPSSLLATGTFIASLFVLPAFGPAVGEMIEDIIDNMGKISVLVVIVYSYYYSQVVFFLGNSANY